jgi:lysophospholipase L1-like esterase
MKEKEKMTIAFFGDSLTEGAIGASYFKILEKKLPEYNLLNYGKNGDPVVGLYKRMNKIVKNEKYNIAFVWIGANDIFVNIKWHFPIMKTLTFQPWAHNKIEFGSYYKKILDMLKNRTDKIFTISPLLIGEDVNNNWNKQLGELSDIIKNLSNSYEQVEYIDLRSIFIQKLSSRVISNYLPTSNTGIFFDYFTLKNDEEINKVSSNRGLHFTIDGAHLNCNGAIIVSDVFYDKIKRNTMVL